MLVLFQTQANSKPERGKNYLKKSTMQEEVLPLLFVILDTTTWKKIISGYYPFNKLKIIPVINRIGLRCIRQRSTIFQA
jgi:hypothetical protein